MYGYQYENDVLRFLRLAKYLHQQDPGKLEALLRLYDGPLNEDMIYELTEEIIWGIFPDVMADEDPETGGAIDTFSHPLIKRFCALSREWILESGYTTNTWLKKLADIAEYYLLGAGYSVWETKCHLTGTSAKIKVWLSADCYDPLEFGNALVDMLLCVQRENERLEELLSKNEQREEAA